MSRSDRRNLGISPGELETIIRRFLSGCRQPVLLEPGQEPIPLEGDRYTLEPRQDSCVLHAWHESGNLVRRVTAIVGETRGRLEARVRRFGSGEATLTLMDAARKSATLKRLKSPLQFRETLRRMIARDFPDWNIEHLTASADLEHSLSGLFARGVLRRGPRAWALIGGAAELGSVVCNQILTFGLIWLAQVWRQQQGGVLAGLHVFLPHGLTRATANRLAFLRRDAHRFCLHEFDGKGHLATLDERDFGNLHTELPPCRPALEPAEPVAGWVGKLLEVPGVEALAGTDGLISLRVRGLSFARAGSGVLACGLNALTPLTAEGLPRALTLARELARFRSPGAADRLNPLYRKYPESWLESQVRRDVSVIDPTLRTSPVYTHPLSTVGADRGIIDLLACDDHGRLAVIELKANEDIHLPLQGLDYWMRVKWHLDRGDFQQRGYFPGIALSSQPPRLLLVSPAVVFHPTTETVLRYFPPEVDVERVGVSEDWRRELRVIFRKAGAARLA
jgi:hypothetical protein